MQVRSPVGTFPLRITGARVADGAPRFDAAMGAWRSEVALDRRDVPLVAAAVGMLAVAFALGRYSRG
jgi:hypothetical protein